MLPFVRPTLDASELDAVAEVLRSGWITSGPKVAEFERALADYLGGGALVRSFNSATSALEMALVACGIGPGDEVILPAMSFTASANVVVRAGAVPRFVDVGLDSRNLDVDAVEAAVNEHTRAIMPVHFAGLPVDMQPIWELARRRGLRVIEDAAHAIGSRYAGRPIGAQGDIVCFSFHPNKNMTTIEGGAAVVFDAELARRLERLRFHGIVRDADGEMDVTEWGGKMNLPDVHAALGLVQLMRLDSFNARRRELVERYFERLPRHQELALPADGEGHSWHIFAVRIDYAALGTKRHLFQKKLQVRGIGTGVHYPAMHLFSLYRGYGYCEGDFPNAERIGAQTLTLPLFPGMSETDVDRVCTALDEVIEEVRRECV